MGDSQHVDKYSIRYLFFAKLFLQSIDAGGQGHLCRLMQTEVGAAKPICTMGQ
jgi:hypothetical protein